MKKKEGTTPTSYDLTDVRDGKVDVPAKSSGLFQVIRKEVKERLPVGKAVLVADLFPLLTSLKDFKGSMRYNYLVNACKADSSFEFVTVNGRKFIGRRQ